MYFTIKLYYVYYVCLKNYHVIKMILTVDQLSQLFIEAITQSRLNLKTKTKEITLDNCIIHVIYMYLLLFHLKSVD